MPIKRETVGTTSEGEEIYRYTLNNDNGLSATVLSYGGTLMALRVPDRQGALGDVLHGFDSHEPYMGDHPYFGSLIGRYGNRIRDGRFELNGRFYNLARNNGPNHLHGGPDGFHRRNWRGRSLPDGTGVELSYRSAHGEEGYPGNLSVTVTYRLTDENGLQIEYEATTDQDTIINLTNHAYFNLAGEGTILEHLLELNASSFLPVDATLIPLGERRPVEGTPMDFRQPEPIGARISGDDEQLRHASGYDHCWVLDHEAGVLGFAARLLDPSSGRVMELYTTEPGVQFYAGNLLDGTIRGKAGQRYGKNSALCLETQHFPDSPNQPDFPSTVLRAGDTYRQTTIYTFSTY